MLKPWKRRVELTDRQVDEAVAKYVREVYQKEPGQVSYQVNKSTGRMYGARVYLLKEEK